MKMMRVGDKDEVLARGWAAPSCPRFGFGALSTGTCSTQGFLGALCSTPTSPGTFCRAGAETRSSHGLLSTLISSQLLSRNLTSKVERSRSCTDTIQERSKSRQRSTPASKTKVRPLPGRVAGLGKALMPSLPLSERIQHQQFADTKSWSCGVLLGLRYCPEAELLPTAPSKILRGWELQSRRRLAGLFVGFVA